MAEALIAALRERGVDTDALTQRDISPFDNLHVGGRGATLDLAALAGIRPHDRVLHLGCGIGGPARTLALERGCRVVGVDITPSYVEAGRTLTRRVGLDDSVSLRVADALRLEFEDGEFDVVWTQHVALNIKDKRALYRQARRALPPGGRLALHEIVQAGGGPPHFPTPWADTAADSFLVSAEALQAALRESGFSVVEWVDDTYASLAWARASMGPVGRASLMELVAGPNFGERAANVRRSLEEGRLGVVRAVCAAI